MNKPHIYRKWYPKSKRHYWNVSPMPPASKRKVVDYDRWKEAYKFTWRLNAEIAEQLHPERKVTE